MSTKAQVIEYINNNLIDNTSKAITPAINRDVLINMLDREYQLSEIPVDIGGISATNLYDALIEIISGNANSEPLTASDIRDLLQTLAGANMLNSNKVKFTDTQTVSTLLSLLLGRQNMAWNEELSYKFNWVVFSGGVWYRSKVDGNLNHAVTDITWWERFALMNGVEIAALLNSLTTINEMVIANRIKYNDSLTVAGKIETMDIEIERKQNKITRNRYLYSNPINGKVFIIGGKTADIFTLHINRTALEGVRALDFNIEAAAYDYIYKTINETDTQITLSPSLGIDFKPGTIIDVAW